MAASAAQLARDGPPPPLPPPPPSKAYKPPPQTTATKRMQKKQREQQERPPRASSANGRQAQPPSNGRPPAVQRQRSLSQPTPVELAPAATPKYGPLSLSTGPSSTPYGQYPTEGSAVGPYGNGGGEAFRPFQSREATMPHRQQRGASPDLPHSEGRNAHHERVLQKGKRGPEDKDCTIS